MTIMIELMFLKALVIRQECIICHDWYLLKKRFRFQQTVCIGCRDILVISISINIISILNIHDVDYYCIILGIGKGEVIYLLR